MSDAQQAEATAAPILVHFADYDYIIDQASITLDVLEADEAGKVLTVVRSLLGEEQYQAYKARHPLASDLAAFRAALLGAMGNSAASSGS